MRWDQLFVFVAYLSSSLICFTQFRRPLVSILNIGKTSLRWSFTFFFTMSRFLLVLDCIKCRTNLKSLLNAFDHIVSMAIWCKSTNYSISTWHVQFLKGLVQLFSEFSLILLQTTNSRFFLSDQKSKILDLILTLSESTFPLKISAINLFSVLNQISVELIVFLNQSLILFLQRNNWLRV